MVSAICFHLVFSRVLGVESGFAFHALKGSGSSCVRFT